MTPLIGITTYSDVARWRDWAVPADYLEREMVSDLLLRLRRSTRYGRPEK